MEHANFMRMSESWRGDTHIKRELVGEERTGLTMRRKDFLLEED